MLVGNCLLKKAKKVIKIDFLFLNNHNLVIFLTTLKICLIFIDAKATEIGGPSRLSASSSSSSDSDSSSSSYSTSSSDSSDSEHGK